MPAVLPNTTTTDAYPVSGAGGAQIGQGDIFGSGFFVVANAAVFAKYFHGIRGQASPSDEIYLPPGTYPLSGTLQDPLGGITFRSAVAGTPAQVFGVFYYPNEAALLASSEFAATVSPTGGISQGGVTDLAYVTFAATVTAVSAVEANAVTVVQAGAITFDGTTKIFAEFYAPGIGISDSTNGCNLILFDTTTAAPLGRIWETLQASAGAQAVPLSGCLVRSPEFIPPAGVHNYFIGICDSIGGGGGGNHAKVFADVGGAGKAFNGYLRLSTVAAS